MPTTKIGRSTWQKMKSHALSCFPDECVGIFECLPSRTPMVLDAFPCRNVSRTKRFQSMISKRDKKALAAKMAAGRRKGLLYGVYHSHPNTGSLGLSEDDKFWGRRYKRYGIQIILGITKNSNGLVVKRAFWKASGRRWTERKMEVG